MNTEKLKLRIRQKKEAIKHFTEHLKKYEDREVKPPDNLIINDDQKDAWYGAQISVLEIKIKYEKERLEAYKQMLKEAGVENDV